MTSGHPTNYTTLTDVTFALNWLSGFVCSMCAKLSRTLARYVARTAVVRISLDRSAIQPALIADLSKPADDKWPFAVGAASTNRLR